MIGYYAHHQGRGHQQRAAVLARELAARGEAVTVLSSAPAPAVWDQSWVVLARDDDPAATTADDPTARGTLHWAPRHHRGLRDRMAAVSAWLVAHDVGLLVTDVSQEITLLARLHGVPVVSVVLPGHRDDPVHALGLQASDALVGCWPAAARGMVTGLAPAEAERVRAVGAVSRYAPVAPRPRRGRTVTVLDSRGGAGFDPALLEQARAQTPDWTWRVLGGSSWAADPWPLLLDSDVVVCHAGQNSLAEVAAARVPAIVCPEDRPYAEQRTTAAVLAAGDWPALVEADLPADGWPARLARARGLDGGRWAAWCDGRAASRFADVVGEVLDRVPT